LLDLVEVIDLIHEGHRSPPSVGLFSAAGPLHQLSQVSHPGAHRVDLEEPSPGALREEAHQGGLAYPWGAIKDAAGQDSLVHEAAQGRPGAHQVTLPHVLGQRPGAHAIRQGALAPPIPLSPGGEELPGVAHSPNASFRIG